MTSDAPPDRESVLLGEWLEAYAAIRAKDASVGIAVMRETSGSLYDELRALADCEALIDLAAAPDEPPPEHFGPYRIVREVGRGATGVVYEVVDPDRDEPVALKVIRESLADDVVQVERFAREAEAMRSLAHPNIARVYESGVLDGRIHYTMELLEGVSLSDLVDRVRLVGEPQPTAGWLAVLDDAGVPPTQGPASDPARAYAARVAACFAPVAEAVAVFGETGRVHRDIKPQNLVLDGRGNLKLTDFGLAKLLGGALTSSNATLGTLAYMSPEQAHGRSREVDVRADVYGLGATLYETLTLERPVDAEGCAETVAAILHVRPAPITDVCGAYPPALAALVARCLEKEPEDRYPTADALARDLRGLATGTRVRVRGVPPWKRALRFVTTHARAAAFTVLVSLGALALTWALLTRPAEIRIRSHPAAVLELDGQVVGRVPRQERVERGEHVLRLTQAGFKDHVEHLDLAAGQLWSDAPVMEPSVPDDPVALALLAESLGIEVHIPRDAPLASRGGLSPTAGSLGALAFVAAPRGLVSPEVGEVRVRTSAPVEGAVVRVTRGGEVLHAADLPATAGDHVVELPTDVVGRLATGGTYRVEVRRTGDEEDVLAADVRVTDAPGAEARLRRFDEDDRAKTHVRLLVAGELLAAGQAAEALVLALDVDREAGGSRTALRFALEALDVLDERSSPAYVDLRTRYDALDTTAD